MTVQFLAQWIILPLLSIALILSFVRMLLGPTLPDRVVALDLISTLGIGVIAVYAIVVDHARLLDVALIVALISFLGTIAFAYYVEQREKRIQ